MAHSTPAHAGTSSTIISAYRRSWRAVIGTAFFKDYALAASISSAVVTVLTALVTFLIQRQPNTRTPARQAFSFWTY